MRNPLFFDSILSEHTEAIALLTAVNECEDGVGAKIYDFLKRVKQRRLDEIARKNAAEAEAAAIALAKRRRKSGGRTKSGRFKVAPRIEHGCDYGNEAIILAEKENIRLIWRYGHAFWANALTGYAYTPGNLSIQILSSGRRPSDVRLTDNHRNAGDPDTRLTKRLIQKFAEKINEVFQCDVANHDLMLKQTIVVGTTRD